MELSDKEKSLLFWGSFLSLMAAGVGFVFRSMVPALWGSHFQVSDTEVGALFGAGLWPIAIMMILFSLIVDKVGYRISMYIALVLQVVSVVGTVMATSYDGLWWACIAAGLGHGVVEAIINPLCASMYRQDKSKMLNILHASWPAGLVCGGLVYYVIYRSEQSWEVAQGVFWFMLIPVAAYGVMFSLVKRFPVDERIDNNVSMLEMLKEFGGLGAFLAVTFLSYEISTQLGLFGDSRLLVCFGIGVLGGVAFGGGLKALGKPLFFILCVIMIPLAAAELATDGWIRKLMEPTLGENATLALVTSAGIMMVLRFFAGVPLKYLSPPALLLVSSVFSIVGLFALSAAEGAGIIIAFVLYAIGQTFYWPTVLGFVAEQFPKGGAMTLNTVSAMGLLTVGIFGFPFLGAVQDAQNAQTIQQAQPALMAKVAAESRTFGDSKKPIVEQKQLFGVKYSAVNTGAVMAQPEFPADQKTVVEGELAKTGRATLRVAAVLPAIMAVAFGLMVIWYKSRGGYQPVVLERGAARKEGEEPEFAPAFQ